jgi:hypothetical protein
MEQYQQLSLRQAGEYDKNTNQREKLTGWGRICKERQEKGISRKARRIRREAAEKLAAKIAS